ncbi:MAG: lactate utilization protein, partial [Chloroflexia bacterium]|nr:lactate utilization protein [Chloroflexia bacterium]
MSREEMLATLRTSLASNRAWLEAEAQKAPHTPPPFVLPPADDLAAQFAAELTKLEGRVYQVADEEEALETLATLLEERQATTAVAWDLAQIGLP